ncbi:hypothetical protein JCM11641_002195 [Rhodosporidiobolus odoratus]
MSSNSASGVGSNNQALGEGSVGKQQAAGQGKDSQSGGREMNDSESSMKGDTSDYFTSLLPCTAALLSLVHPVVSSATSHTASIRPADVNNEYPSNAGSGADFKTDQESSKFSSEGSSEASSATQ